VSVADVLVLVDGPTIPVLPGASLLFTTYPGHIGRMNRPGESGDSSPWEGWSHVRFYVEEVPGRAA
jgi:hypothetical protein